MSGSSELRLAAQTALQAINAIEPQLRAWTFLADPQTIHGPVGGPLSGLALGVKDNIDVAGMPTWCGSSFESGAPAQLDAACVALLRTAGAIPIGKTVTTEFAYVTPGPTRNPRNVLYTPGGSSSGSAAAVAARTIPIALGTQTGGSIIRPAAFCGVIGFKPSSGLVSRDGMKVTCESLDVIGWYGSSIEHVKAVANVLLPDCKEQTRNFPNLRIACFPDPVHELENEASNALACARMRLISHGANVPETRDFTMAAELLRTHSVLMHYELSRSLHAVVTKNEGALSARLAAAIRHGWKISGSEYVRAREMQHQSQSKWTQWFGDVDLILTTGALGAAPMGLDHTGDSAFNKGWSVLGWPCIHLPTAYASNGLPIGVMLVARPFADLDLLEWAKVIHAVIDQRPIEQSPVRQQP